MVFHSKIVKLAVDELSKISWGTFTIFGSLLLMYSFVRKVKMNKILPPGPLGKPWVGVLFNIKKQFHMYLFDLWQNYGSIFSFKMGSHLVVVLGDAKLMRMAFAKEAFSARPKSELSSILGGYGEDMPVLIICTSFIEKSIFLFLFRIFAYLHFDFLQESSILRVRCGKANVNFYTRRNLE